MRSLPFLVLAACAPPPEVGADPAIAFVFPPDQYELTLDPDGSAVLVVAVAIDNLELTEPGAPLKDGEGHWHLETAPGSYIPVAEAFAEFTFPPAPEAGALVAGELRRLRATLQANDHSDLDSFPQWEASIEIQVVGGP